MVVEGAEKDGQRKMGQEAGDWEIDSGSSRRI